MKPYAIAYEFMDYETITPVCHLYGDSIPCQMYISLNFRHNKDESLKANFQTTY